MIKIAGKRGSLADLNRKLLGIDGVIDGVIFAPSDNCRRLAALVVTDGLSTSAVIEPLRREIDAVFMPRPVFRVPRLPRQETGKLSRSATLELFEHCRAKQSGAA
jgi:acyl-coenzyme A synthetase/AMP-(fatty) acid ligase